MEFLVGSFVTIIVLNLITKKLQGKIDREPIKPPIYTQSYMYELTKVYLQQMNAHPSMQHNQLKTQAVNYFDKKHVRIVIYDDKAYWISEQALYSADFDGEEVVKGSMQRVDTMGMDKVELEKVVYIVDLLTEGMDDSGNSRNT